MAHFLQAGDPLRKRRAGRADRGSLGDRRHRLRRRRAPVRRRVPRHGRAGAAPLPRDRAADRRRARGRLAAGPAVLGPGLRHRGGPRLARRTASAALDAAEIVAITVPENRRSQAVMRRLGMRPDRTRDFDHPMLPEGHRLRPHLLYAAVARGLGCGARGGGGLMRLVVLGVGAIGGTVAAALALAGQPVVGIARGAVRDAIAARGLTAANARTRPVRPASPASAIRPRSASPPATPSCSRPRPRTRCRRWSGCARPG